MSFLESIQHGLEKATHEAARLANVQHLHNIANDLGFKLSQEGQALIAKTMEVYASGRLSEPELLSICQQIATYQQQINEVHMELQKYQNPEEATVPPPPAPPEQAIPSYNEQPVASYAPPVQPVSEPPTAPGSEQPAEEVPPVSSEPPTQPGAAQPVVESTPAEVDPPVVHQKAHHASKAKADAPAADAPAADAPARTSYEDGALPPVFSPFASQPAAAAPAQAEAEAPAEEPAKVHHHRAKKADGETETEADKK